MTPRGLENLFAFGFVEWQWEKRVERQAIIKKKGRKITAEFRSREKYVEKKFRNQQITLDECRWDVTSSLDEGSKISFLRKNNSVQVPAGGLRRPSTAHALKIINEMENERKTIP